MSSFQTLPDAIISQILSTNTEFFEFGIVNSWKSLLPILGISQKWRQLGLPLVYKHAFIDNTNHGTLRCVQWKTNINLILENNLVHLVHNLYIDLNDHSCLCLFLSNANKIFGFTGHDWSNVECLTVKYYENTFGDNLIDDERQKVLEPQMANFADSIVKNMPGITRLKLSTFKQNSLGDIVSNRLANSFASQLRLLKSCKAIPFTVPKLGANITHLNLWLNPLSTQLLPLVNAESLHCLHLFDVPASFSWKYFYSNSAPAGHINFKNLVHLRLEFTEDSNDIDYCSEDPSSLFKVKFPKLELLRIDNSPRTSDIYYDNEYPEHIERVEINYSLGALDMLRMSNLRSFREFEFYSRHVDAKDQGMFYRATNHFFGSAHKGTVSRMTLYGLQFELDIEQLEWDGLAELLIFSSCEFQTLYALIEKLPSLIKLVVDDLSFNHIPESKLLMGPDARLAIPRKPINTKIQQMHIFNTSGDQCYSEVAANSLHYLMLQTKSLCELFAYDCDWLNLTGFVNQFKIWYPHLGKIVINLQ